MHDQNMAWHNYQADTEEKVHANTEEKVHTLSFMPAFVSRVSI